MRHAAASSGPRAGFYFSTCYRFICFPCMANKLLYISGQKEPNKADAVLIAVLHYGCLYDVTVPKSRLISVSGFSVRTGAA